VAKASRGFFAVGELPGKRSVSLVGFVIAIG
jgi:hypothetical protein